MYLIGADGKKSNVFFILGNDSKRIKRSSCTFSLFFSFFIINQLQPEGKQMSTLNFSVERPFGIYLFDYFDQLYTAIVGQSAKEFHFVQGITPLSTLHEGKLYARESLLSG